ncbi:hypothetical protein GGI21_004985, partial [Coemansia aciculifera]
MFAPRANAHLCSKLRISAGSLSSHRCYAYVRPNPVVTPGKAPKPKHGHPVKLKFKTKGSRGITLANTNMELLYGNSPIRAALQQGRREIYGLYYQGGFMGDEPRTEMNELISMAKAQAVP